MKRCLRALAAGTVLALGGCGVLDPGSGHPAGAAPTGPATAPATDASATSGFGSVKDSGDIPGPCPLLSRDEVVELTGRAITQIDEDGGSPGDATRYCQWQQDGGQLAVFLSRTTADDFQSTITGAQPVDGVGEDAFSLAGHLYVLYGTVQIDVYSRGGSDEENLADATRVAEVLIPRV